MLKSDLDMFLIMVPCFLARCRKTLHRRDGGGRKMRKGRRREYDPPPNDALQITPWQFRIYKFAIQSPFFKCCLCFEL
jgi:hypothetical protein